MSSGELRNRTSAAGVLSERKKVAKDESGDTGREQISRPTEPIVKNLDVYHLKY